MLTQRFWDKVTKTDGCWLWIGAKNRKGYGHIKIDGKTESAYVLSFTDANGITGPATGKKISIHHRCENPACVRPDHLEAVTYSEHLRKHPRQKAHTCKDGHSFVPRRGRGCQICFHQRRIAYHQDALDSLRKLIGQPVPATA